MKPKQIQKALKKDGEQDDWTPKRHNLVVDIKDWSLYEQFYGETKPNVVSALNTEMIRRLTSGDWEIVEKS